MVQVRSLRLHRSHGSATPLSPSRDSGRIHRIWQKVKLIGWLVGPRNDNVLLVSDMIHRLQVRKIALTCVALQIAPL